MKSKTQTNLALMYN